MGTRFQVAGKYVFQVQDYSIEEDTTPLAAGDTYGSTGTLTVTFQSPDPDVPRRQDTGEKWVLDYGRDILQGKSFIFEDTKWGVIDGVIDSVGMSQFGNLQVTCNTSLNQLNAYNIKAKPYVGTLGGLIRYYCGLAGTVAPDIDVALDTRPIQAPGWVGELWYYLKMLAVAEEFEIALVNTVPTFRLLRQRTLVKGREISLSGDRPVNTLAQSVECYQYSNTAIANQLVYPPGGWSPEVEVFNVNAGEVVEYTVQLSASVSSIQEPVMVESVSPDYSASSVYTVVANDGLPVTPEMWADRSGSLHVIINEDTTSLTIRIRGAHRVPTAKGWATNFSIALASDESSSRYSTLRLVGTGVAFNKVKKTFRTGLTKNETGTDIGVTIDNPFLSTKNQCFRAGVRAAVQYSGANPTLGSEISKAFRNGGGLGLVSGSRVFDTSRARPFRARSTSFKPGSASITFEDDLIHDDQEAFRMGMTYGDVQASRSGMTYRDDDLMGVR